MLDALFAGFGSLLALFYDLVPSYGSAIMMLTVAVMLATFPLTLKQTRSMLAMQRLAPELKRLQKEFKGDRQAMSEAQMALYKEHGVNPLAGCLPMILQMPVFIVLFNVIRGLTHHAKGGEIEPKYVPHSSEIFHALREAGGTMYSFGIDLAKAPNANHGSFVKALPYYGLVALSFGSNYIQLQRMSARNPQAAQANPQMQMMNRIFPIMSGFFCLTVPAGVGLYLVVSNIFRLVQQELMYKFDPHVTKHHLALREGKIIDVDERAEQKKATEPKAKAIETKTKPAPDASDEEPAGEERSAPPTKPLPPRRSGSNGANGGARGASGAGKARNQRRKKKKGR